MSYDALLLVSFGGPERPEDVLPFLENVTRGKNVSAARLAAVAAHYDLFDGVSPINAANRALLAALLAELNQHGPSLPVYWGNRFWHPLLADGLRQMADDGVRRALAFVTSAFGSPPGCRAYRDDLASARAEIGPDAPAIDVLRLYYNHPGFIAATAERLRTAFEQVAAERRPAVRIIFTAHSIPTAMAETSPYERQLREACRLAAAECGCAAWQLAYQSRSGPPAQPWLGPELADVLRAAAAAGATDVVLAPIGFVCDHMEVVYDLDVEAAALCDELGLRMVRAGTVGCHPRFVQMIRELVVERLDPSAPRPALGDCGPWPDVCPDGCCQTAPQPPAAAGG